MLSFKHQREISSIRFRPYGAFLFNKALVPLGNTYEKLRQLKKLKANEAHQAALQSLPAHSME